MVKLLEEPRLMEVNMMLAGLQTGSSVIEGRLDLYSCKLAGTDPPKPLERTTTSLADGARVTMHPQTVAV